MGSLVYCSRLKLPARHVRLKQLTRTQSRDCMSPLHHFVQRVLKRLERGREHAGKVICLEGQRQGDGLIFRDNPDLKRFTSVLLTP